MPSLATTPATVFGRFTGRKAAVEQQLEGGRRLSPPIEVEAKNKSLRRQSSVLSLTSVTEIGQNVKRSVSLRSHRSQPSNSSNPGHKTRSSSSAVPFQPALTTSPVEDDEPHDWPPPVQPFAPFQPRIRGRPSASARSLSSKFSSQSLSTFGPSESTSTLTEPPSTAGGSRRLPSSSSMLAPPATPKRAPPERPPLPPPVPSFPPDPGASIHAPTPFPNEPKVVFKQIHETSAKRMATIEYLRKVHEGNIFYFSTLHYSSTSLQSIPSMHPLKLGRRATNYFVLGYSLPALLDSNTSTPLEYLRALTALLQEFETYQNLMGMDSSGNSLGRGRVGNMFKIGNRANKGRRTSTATTDPMTAMSMLPFTSSGNLDPPKSASEAVSPLEASPISPSDHNFQHLVTPHLPFDPDFTTIYATLCDTLIDTYAKLLDLIPGPDACNPALADAFAKVDKTLRKIIIANVTREFEESTRANIKSEVAGLGKLVLGGLM